jgi:hypothetical protein
MQLHEIKNFAQTVTAGRGNKGCEPRNGRNKDNGQLQKKKVCF